MALHIVHLVLMPHPPSNARYINYFHSVGTVHQHQPESLPLSVPSGSVHESYSNPPPPRFGEQMSQIYSGPQHASRPQASMDRLAYVNAAEAASQGRIQPLHELQDSRDWSTFVEAAEPKSDGRIPPLDQFLNGISAWKNKKENPSSSEALTPLEVTRQNEAVAEQLNFWLFTKGPLSLHIM